MTRNDMMTTTAKNRMRYAKATPALVAAALITALVAALIALALAPSTARAQAPQPPVTVEVSDSDITMDDVLTLTVVVHDQPNMYLPTLPAIDGLGLLGSSRRLTSAYQDGALSSRAEFRYTFRPLRTGDIEIGPISVRLEGRIHVTDPIPITVAPGTLPIPPAPVPQIGAPPPRVDSLAGQNFYSEAEVDNAAPYIGEQITHTFRFFSTDPARRPTYTAPDFAGFWKAGDLPEIDDERTEGGRRYSVTEINTVLFPALAGSAQIEAGSMMVYTGFFGSGRAEFPSEPVSVSVKPLPSGEPSGFGGAVGEYRIEARVDRDDVGMGEPVNLSVIVSGAGNFQHLPDPVWRDSPGWRAYEGDTDTLSEIDANGVVRGAKLYERVYIPEASGELTIPPVEFSYFDPKLEEYATASTKAIHVKVAPGAGGATGAASPDAVADPPAVEDIRHIKPISSAARSASPPLGGNPLYLSLWALPPLAVAAALGWRLARRRRDALADARRPALAGELALSRLSSADADDSAADVAALALRGYLEAALGPETRGMTPDQTAALALERGASSRTARNLLAALRELDATRFGPAADPRAESMPREVAEIVRELGAELAR